MGQGGGGGVGVEFTCQPELKDGRAGRARARERERGVPPPRPGFQQLKRLADRLTPISRNPSTLDHPSCIRANSNFLLRVIHVNGSRGYSARVDHDSDSFLFSSPSFLLFSARGWFAKRKG